MGMAASQARLLCITARIHDVEYQSQSIQNAKLQLATQSDAVYEEYMAALDDQTMVISTIDNTGMQSSVAATFKNMCSRDRLTPSSYETKYALRDARGRLIVEDDIATGYMAYRNSTGGKSAEAFALYMLYGAAVLGNIDGTEPDELNSKVIEAERNIWSQITGSEPVQASQRLQEIHTALLECTESEDIYDTSNIVGDEDKTEKYNKLLSEYRKELYSSHGKSIIDELDPELDGVGLEINEYETKTQPLFNYYVDIYNQIESNGGLCIGIGKFDGFNGNAANDSDWLTAMVQSGQITVEMVKSEDDGKIKFDTTSPSSDTCLKYTETITIDSRAAKKAEAKYEHDLGEIERKDKEYDLSLSKLETERTALTTEYDSLKKVIEENIERTFGIFS